jgi:CRISPR/Cas system-associated exonuclease Cas4 (RecB family)
VRKINTLIKDIYSLFTTRYTPNPDNVKTFGNSLASLVEDRLSERKDQAYLRPSNIGQPCDRKLWYSINTPDKAEPLSPTVKFKFLYGDIIEALVLFLAAEAGHKVEGCQETVEIAGVKGKRDAIIDGVLIDVKSANSRSFKKFEDHTLAPGNDPFGYLQQLDFYLKASEADEKLTTKDRAAFFAVDKELGHLVVDLHPRLDQEWEEVIAEKRDLLARESPPDRAFEDVPEGKSGNRRLTVPCTYCPFKKTCWPNLRTYIYSNGPMFLTNVTRAPKVTEVPALTATA